ncbi:MAG: hypothetical protein A3A82_01630 [Candidatus Pacebacteria bacterium RIFCSPLOWO2_01_FULL_47_12]|nr:MAG: hypothetical protein A3J60_02630 [Candidatus Pacebacteria bacterium RIFCSPHIGHO2_02_FULL_46_9]OGJ39393.1 MAG: hypothetical protein A3A82_01630 [Candidatus Pacebacteria bacterium RIFCSPLOWO2_01_FULL_47_12]
MTRNASIITLCLVTGLFTTVTQSVFAQDASDSGRTTREIKKRIDRVIEEKKQEVAGALAEISSKKRAFVGPIERVSESSLTIATHKGALVLPLSPTVKVLKKSEKIAVTDLAVGNRVVALGIETDGMFEPKFILTTGNSEQPKKRIVLLGSVTLLEKTKLTLQTRGSNEIKVITLGKTTKYQNADGSTIALKLLEEDITVLVVASESETGLTASTIRSLAPLDVAE